MHEGDSCVPKRRLRCVLVCEAELASAQSPRGRSIYSRMPMHRKQEHMVFTAKHQAGDIGKRHGLLCHAAQTCDLWDPSVRTAYPWARRLTSRGSQAACAMHVASSNIVTCREIQHASNGSSQRQTPGPEGKTFAMRADQTSDGRLCVHPFQIPLMAVTLLMAIDLVYVRSSSHEVPCAAKYLIRNHLAPLLAKSCVCRVMLQP